jgi:hypothetical protein
MHVKRSGERLLQQYLPATDVRGRSKVRRRKPNLLEHLISLDKQSIWQLDAEGLRSFFD